MSSEKIVNISEKANDKEVVTGAPLELTREEFNNAIEQYHKGKSLYGMSLKETEEYLVKQGERLDFLEGNPTRQEVIEIMEQVGENINQISDYLMQDVNTMYSQHVFPFQIRLEAIENLLVAKGIFTKEEVNSEAERLFDELKEKAQEIKESGENENTGKDDLTPKE